jgi:hypothetical protein
MKTRFKLFNGFMILAALLLIVPAALAVGPSEPVYVDDLNGPFAPDINGDDGEWAASDYFADMLQAGGNGGHTEVLSKVYLRFECATRTLYARVRVNDAEYPGIVIDTGQSGEHYVKIDGTKIVDDQSSSFAFVYSGTPSYVGWEASGQIFTDGSHSLNVHTNVLYGGSQTSQVEGGDIPLFIDCTPPTAVELSSFEAASAGDAIRLAWATGSELDALGFNLFRAESVDGPRSRLNSSFIAAQSPGSPLGATYEFVDSSVSPGATYYYWLEAVDGHGEAQMHGPVSEQVTVLRRLSPIRSRLAPSHYIVSGR